MYSKDAGFHFWKTETIEFQALIAAMLGQGSATIAVDHGGFETGVVSESDVAVNPGLAALLMPSGGPTQADA